MQTRSIRAAALATLARLDSANAALDRAATTCDAARRTLARLERLAEVRDAADLVLFSDAHPANVDALHRAIARAVASRI
jgi:hypothetical protein